MEFARRHAAAEKLSAQEVASLEILALERVLRLCLAQTILALPGASGLTILSVRCHVVRDNSKDQDHVRMETPALDQQTILESASEVHVLNGKLGQSSQPVQNHVAVESRQEPENAQTGSKESIA